jgi:hypothetical protein
MKWARSIAMAGAAAAAMMLAAPAWADVTVTETTGGKMFGAGDMTGTKVTRIKGHKMRQDMNHPGRDNVSMIFDVDSGKMIILNHAKKEAMVRSTADIGQAMGQISDADVKSSLTDSGQAKTVAGASCNVFDTSISVSFSMMEKAPPMTMVMTGPVCLSKTAPGHEDFRNFYLAAAEKGFIFTDPQAAKAQPGMAKAMQTMARKMAEGGLPLSSDLNMTFEGDNPMAQMMKKMGGAKMTSEATKIETTALSDDIFAVQAGYKTKTN